MKLSVFVTLVLSSFATALPSLKRRGGSFVLQNGIDAINLNNQFQSLTASSPCTSGNACVNGEFAQCVNGQYVLTSCGSGLTCAALPLVNSAGTSITCTTQADLNSRIAATGATANGTSTTGSPSNATATSSSALVATSTTGSGSNSNSNAQTSLTLLSSLVAPNFAQNGQNTNTSEAGEVPSLTSTNNFINYCATLSNLPITNGQQIQGGSCNPAPMGAIPSTSNMPSAKFVSPNNLAVLPANTTFQVTLAIRGIETGFFVNPDTNYFSAPQQIDPTSGQIQGHAHIVIEALQSLTQTTPTDPSKFAFFVGLNSKADASGQLHASITNGLPEGTYKMSTIVTAMNHQPVLVAVAQHGSLDDQIYFTVVAPGQNGTTTTTTSIGDSPLPSTTSSVSSVPTDSGT
ncbi:uncharacterized protein F5147DRAFT_635006 [Suillus discolor]|uniref:Carbohydrate-binding module family 19 domain-containing protein n=1 Tax=Suillus discolor TaxID=1912936 RepID=A0A9P7JUS4_9AGAM|nr:uncharacterized protein F5147DRAFT_635006 [Suillus discolor]KAG2109615.1 hypothetical protein F5147DRAFT_635006 [Suillus discolor]